jgi:choline dehydrogenase
MAAFGEIKGVEYPPDSGAGLPGVFWYPTSADPKTMTRSLARTGHWDGIQRSNYDTITGQKVLKVVIASGRATGVTFVPAKAKTLDEAQTVKAKKEVIVATGTIHTPQLLQGSGIGPKALLEAAGIEVKVDLPGVGQNFQDHPLNGGASFNCESFTAISR